MTMINYDIGSAVPGDIIMWSVDNRHGKTKEIWILLDKENMNKGYGVYYGLTIINQVGTIMKWPYDPEATTWTSYQLIK